MKKQGKKLLSMLLTMALLVAVLSVLGVGMNVSATSITQAQAVAWAESKVGSTLDYDGVYGGQCVDLIYYYYQYLGESPRGGNGSDYAWNALPSGWQRISYSAGAVPQPGDIVVWSYTASAEGHVAIAISGSSSGFYAIDQNWNWLQYCTKNWHNYTYGTIACFIRPNFAGSNPISWASVADGTYYFRNGKTGQYLVVAQSADVQNQNVIQWPFTGESGMQWKITSDNSGVRFQPVCSSSRLLNIYTATYSGGTWVVSDGDNVCIQDVDIHILTRSG